MAVLPTPRSPIKIGLFFFILLTINALIYFVIIAYIQKLVNSHLALADNVTIVLSFVALLFFIISLYRFFHRNINNVLYFY